MKEYIKLSIDAEAYYSGNTYYEEVFLTKEIWEEMKDSFQTYTYLTEFDGKHSEVKVEIEIEEMTEKELTKFQSNEATDGDTLFYHVEEYLNLDTYDNHYLRSIQNEVKKLCQVESMTIKINKNQKEEVLKLLESYLV